MLVFECAVLAVPAVPASALHHLSPTMMFSFVCMPVAFSCFVFCVFFSLARNVDVDDALSPSERGGYLSDVCVGFRS